MTFAVITGLAVSGLYLMIALGFTLMLRVADIVNLLHGTFVVGGMYLTVVFTRDLGLNFFVSLLPTLCLGLLGCWLLYEAVLKSARRQGHRAQIIYTLLLFSIFEIGYEILFGGAPQRADIPRLAWSVLGVAVRREQVVGFIVAVLVTALFFAVFRYTAFGKSAEIAGKYPEGAAAIGLPVERLYRTVYLVGSAMALLAGAFLVAAIPVTPFQSFEYLIIAIIIGIAARLSFAGCVAAALLFGLGYQILVALTSKPQLATVGIYGLFLALIALSPVVAGLQQSVRQRRGRRGSNVLSEVDA